jgi:hypothetical protein
MNILFNLNIMIESYDKITTCQGCSLGISEMGKDIGLEWREANSGNGATVSISGDIVRYHSTWDSRLVRAKHGFQ